MIFRPSRVNRGPDPFLSLKMILLALGGVIAVAGFMLRIDWLVAVAMVPLVLGLGLNLRRSSGDAPESGADFASDADSGSGHDSGPRHPG